MYTGHHPGKGTAGESSAHDEAGAKRGGIGILKQWYQHGHQGYPCQQKHRMLHSNKQAQAGNNGSPYWYITVHICRQSQVKNKLK